MKDYGNLIIPGDPTTLGKLIPVMEDVIVRNSGWSRDHALERDWTAGMGFRSYCFSCTETADRRAAHLWLDLSGDNNARVTNIVPAKVSSLSYDEYNAVLRDFFETIAKPAAAKLDLSPQFSTGETSIRDWLNEDTVKLLENFAQSANRSTGSAHPQDKERWHAFVVAAHRDGTELDTRVLKRWLHEEAGFPVDIALDLAREYESALELLDYYDSAAA